MDYNYLCFFVIECVGEGFFDWLLIEVNFWFLVLNVFKCVKESWNCDSWDDFGVWGIGKKVCENVGEYGL